MASALIRIVLGRLCTAVPLLAAVITLTFFLIHLAPGDPAYILAGDTPTPEFLHHIRAVYDLDKPVGQQFLAFLAKAAKGDFGTSIYYHQPVFSVILDRFPATLLLTAAAMAIAIAAGVWIAALAAGTPGSPLDVSISALSLIGLSVPTFWLGQIAILVFALHLRWLPVGGFESVRHGFEGPRRLLDVGWHLLLPTALLATFLLSLIARFTRTAMSEALSRDFIMVAQAKGVSERGVLWAHAFRVAATSTVTVIGLEFGTIIAGAVLVETICGWPGLGRLFYDAVAKRDFPLLTGSFIFTAVVVTATNLVTDLVCAMLDPRLRRS